MRIVLGTHAKRCACLAAVLLAVLPARAERTRHWRQSSYSEFDKGTANGVALRSDGRLVLSPRFAEFADPSAAYLWALHFDPQGRLYAAGGSNAKVLRFDAQGAATTVFESGEMAAQALTFDARGNLYIGTSPDGKVYRVTPAGEKSVFFDPKTKYIWDLVADSGGTLYVATGDKGEIYAVKPDGKGEVFYASEETHIRALAFDSRGNLLAGTEPGGLILRITNPAATAGSAQAFVLYDSPKKEITSLLVDRAGNIYAAAIGEKARPGQAFPQVPGVTPQPTPQPAIPQQQPAMQVQQQQQPTPFIPFAPLLSSAVYRIAPDGAPEEVWGSPADLVYALGLSPAGRLLLGTGNRGVVIQLEGGAVFSNLVKTGSSQVTGIAQGPGGKTYLCTANPGKILTLGPGDQSEGTFESQTFDAKTFSQWGRITWWGQNTGSSASPKPGARTTPIELYVRSGNTEDPGKEWSPWAGPYSIAGGQKAEAPSARFVQWKAVFHAVSADGYSGSTPASAAPNLDWVNLSYLPKNVAPVIDGIMLQNPGVRIVGMGAPPQGPGAPQPVQLRMPPPPPSQVNPFALQQQQPERPQHFEAPPQGFQQKGWQAVVWSARDDNDDDLTYSIYFRGEGEQTWKLLKDKLDTKYYSWDTSSMPDGPYYLKIVASDAPSNPPDETLTAERESDRFTVDNTPPVVENLRADAASSDVRVRFTARDSASAIAAAQYSLDAGPWIVVLPLGRLSDAPVEDYDFVLQGLTPGEHTLAVQAADQFENSAGAKVTFTVPPPKR